MPIEYPKKNPENPYGRIEGVGNSGIEAENRYWLAQLGITQVAVKLKLEENFDARKGIIAFYDVSSTAYLLNDFMQEKLKHIAGNVPDIVTNRLTTLIEIFRCASY